MTTTNTKNILCTLNTDATEHLTKFLCQRQELQKLQELETQNTMLKNLLRDFTKPPTDFLFYKNYRKIEMVQEYEDDGYELEEIEDARNWILHSMMDTILQEFKELKRTPDYKDRIADIKNKDVNAHLKLLETVLQDCYCRHQE